MSITEDALKVKLPIYVFLQNNLEKTRGAVKGKQGLRRAPNQINLIRAPGSRGLAVPRIRSIGLGPRETRGLPEPDQSDWDPANGGFAGPRIRLS